LFRITSAVNLLEGREGGHTYDHYATMRLGEHVPTNNKLGARHMGIARHIQFILSSDTSECSMCWRIISANRKLTQSRLSPPRCGVRELCSSAEPNLREIGPELISDVEISNQLSFMLVPQQAFDRICFCTSDVMTLPPVEIGTRTFSSTVRVLLSNSERKKIMSERVVDLQVTPKKEKRCDGRSEFFFFVN
jgi:hypothetical protein